MHLTIQMPPSSRSLRRGKDEIPDFYPQRDGQKEVTYTRFQFMETVKPVLIYSMFKIMYLQDELTEDNVKRGFSNIGIGSFSAHEVVEL